jgi:hypothetical protein
MVINKIIKLVYKVYYIIASLLEIICSIKIGCLHENQALYHYK